MLEDLCGSTVCQEAHLACKVRGAIKWEGLTGGRSTTLGCIRISLSIEQES
jgi:hypothetical protein